MSEQTLVSAQDDTRRSFTKKTLGGLLTLSLLETVFQRDAFAKGVKPLAVDWLAEVNDISQSLRGRKLSQFVWQQQVESLMEQADVSDLMKFLDFEKMTKNIKFREKGELSLRPKFPEVEGLPKNLVYGTQMFALRKDRSVVPHGHTNMATAFIIVKGEFHGRHFDRLEDHKDSMVIRPTIDKTFGPGGHSSISDHKDNVHWFKTISDVGYIFNIHVLNLSRTRRVPTGRVYIDPDGEKLADGAILAPKMSHKDAHQKYG